MPPPRKVNLLPQEIRIWLQDTLKERGFSGYKEITDELNQKLAEEGIDLEIGKSSINEFGQEFEEIVRMHEQASEEMKAVLKQLSAGEEVDMTSALAQQLVALQWKWQKAAMSNPAAIDPRGMKDLSTTINNLLRSRELRERIIKDEKAKMGAVLQEAVDAGDIQEDFMILAKQKMGFG